MILSWQWRAWSFLLYLIIVVHLFYIVRKWEKRVSLCAVCETILSLFNLHYKGSSFLNLCFVCLIQISDDVMDKYLYSSDRKPQSWGGGSQENLWNGKTDSGRAQEAGGHHRGVLWVQGVWVPQQTHYFEALYILHFNSIDD